MSSENKAIRYCIVDNNSLEVICYCYHKSEAKRIIDGLNKSHDINPEKEFKTTGYRRFTCQDFMNFGYNTKMELIQQFVRGFMMEGYDE